MNKEIYEEIKKHEIIMIHPHVSPDGDCLGAAFGLKDTINNSFKDKKAFVVGESVAYLEFLGEIDIVEDSMFTNALSIIVDTPIADRVADQRFKLAKNTIKIDHHKDVEDFTNIKLVKSKYAATCEILVEYIKSNQELKMTEVGATAFYIGIITDTGGFRYKGVVGRTFELAGYLVDNKANVPQISNQLSKMSLDELLFKKIIFNNIKTYKNIIYTFIKEEEYKQFNLETSEVANNVNMLSNIESQDIWFLAYERDDKTIRVRLRSRNTPIREVAAMFNGGGHDLASGATLNHEDEIPDLLNELVKL